MSLREWRKSEGLTQTEAARALDAGGLRTVQHWEKRTRIPVPTKVAEIWVRTRGVVDPNSLYVLPELPPDAMLARAARLEAEAAELRALAGQRLGAVGFYHVTGGEVDAGPCQLADPASTELGAVRA